jgi:hypothetical protein
MSTTTTATAPRQRKARPKPERFVRLCVKPQNGTAGVLRIRVGKEESDYLLTEIASDFGRGFKLEKIGLEANGEAYHVNLDAKNKTCECKGFLRWQHCKHADSLAALIAAQRL